MLGVFVWGVVDGACCLDADLKGTVVGDFVLGGGDAVDLLSQQLPIPAEVAGFRELGLCVWMGV